MGNLKNKWYQPNKIVPKDLILNNTIIKSWIMDDGTVCKRDKNLIFCTHGFSLEECQFLSQKINEFIGFNCANINKDGIYFKIRISRKGTKEMFKVIGFSEVECFNYKWLRSI